MNMDEYVKLLPNSFPNQYNQLVRFVLTQASNNYKNRTSSRSGAALAQSEELGKKNKKLKK